MKYCICRQQQLLTKCALFMPDAAQTPYPAYKIMLIQYIAEIS
ncbi:4-phosphopantetheinyl transferase EntD [Escherichia coli]|nr:4-phosphopantetheinyl transferase EntD [Escherichia coli]OUK94313.1 4-phosphopantetheinyl transferase EntD [Escherichia coli]OUK99660.1 4-phosphopantetheinyl transferase EntD [Escherichia coli]